MSARHFGIRTSGSALGGDDKPIRSPRANTTPRDSLDPFGPLLESLKLAETDLDKAAMHFFVGFIGAICFGLVLLYALVVPFMRFIGL